MLLERFQIIENDSYGLPEYPDFQFELQMLNQNQQYELVMGCNDRKLINAVKDMLNFSR